MAFTNLKTTQVSFLETYLRGTNQTLTSAQAAATFGVKNLRARVHDLRNAGLKVSRVPTKTTGQCAYRISRRDISGTQSRVFA